MPSRYFFNRLARSHSPTRKSRAQLAREKAEIESVFAPSFPNGLPEPYLWKVTHRHRRPSKKAGSSPKGDSKDAKGGFTDDESVLKMGNMFEGLTDDSEFRISMGQGVKDPSLASNTNDASGSKDSSLDLDVIESVQNPSLVLEVKNWFSKESDPGEKKAQAYKQQAEPSPAFLTISLAGRSKTPASPKQSPNSPLIGMAEPPKDPCSKAVKAIDPSTDPDHLESSKLPSGERSRMKNYLERTNIGIRAKPPGVRNSALARSAASLRYAASHRSRYATHGLMMNGGYRLYRRPTLLGTASLAPRPIPQIFITPPRPEERDSSSTNAVFDFNSFASPSPGPSPNPSTIGTTAEVPVSEAQPLAGEGEEEQDEEEEKEEEKEQEKEEEKEEEEEKEKGEEEEAFDQKLARILESYINSAKVRNELRREVYKLFTEEKGITSLLV